MALIAWYCRRSINLRAQWPRQRTPQRARAHGSNRRVDDGEQRRGLVARQALFQLEIAARGGVEHQRVRAFLDLESPYVRQRRALRVPDVLQQSAGRTQCQRQFVDAESTQVHGAELIGQQPRGGCQLEMPRCARAHRRGRPFQRGQFLGLGFRQQQFRGTQALELGAECLEAVELHDAEAARGQLEPCQAEPGRLAPDGSQQRLAPLLQQRLVRHRAGGHHPHYLPCHRSARRPGISELFADGDRLAATHEPRQVVLDAVHRHAGHRHVLARGLAT